MNIQAIIVTVIILAAVIYVGLTVWRKVKSFSPKTACGSGCGCASSSKTSKIQI